MADGWARECVADFLVSDRQMNPYREFVILRSSLLAGSLPTIILK